VYFQRFNKREKKAGEKKHAQLEKTLRRSSQTRSGKQKKQQHTGGLAGLEGKKNRLTKK